VKTDAADINEKCDFFLAYAPYLNAGCCLPFQVLLPRYTVRSRPPCFALALLCCAARAQSPCLDFGITGVVNIITVLTKNMCSQFIEPSGVRF
jgi:hypothetical protein